MADDEKMTKGDWFRFWRAIAVLILLIGSLIALIASGGSTLESDNPLQILALLTFCVTTGAVLAWGAGWGAISLMFGSFVRTVVPGICLALVWAIPAYPLWTQISAWLKFGNWYPRDVFWLISNPDCRTPAIEFPGSSLKDRCREDYLQVTEWVGVNQIVNYIFSWHVSLLFLSTAFLIIIIASTFRD